MKFEKITENKVKIIVPFEELEKRNITLHDIEINSNAAKDFFTLFGEIFTLVSQKLRD